ncbi:DUF4982 domain-containing protein [Vibrio astriarenae]|uniref:DUF4982 domain-containing protein n=1 Tax=Vibrio astriarenae TaxID=1481923 RepID=A0A7Z2T2M7_9VIBR|nr:glycoside hydrolase family 2 TIM barrel-domain containing protein [Vibrio astriarenae]QIA63231.1 DUF4982 domain-containing protein [Vibrio astriarenae]
MNPSPRHTCLFNHDWLFQLNEEHPQPDDWNPITLPHDWSISLPFSEQYDGATGYLPGGVGWYKKTFSNPLSNKFKRCFIHFDGIYNNSEIMLNGNLIHKQNYGYSPFVLDVTPFLNDNNEIVVKVDRRRYVDSRWYTGSGIYRDVELILTGDHYSPLWSNIIEAKLEQPDHRLGTINQSVTLCSPETEHSATGRLVTQVIDLQSLKVVNENRTDFTPSASTLVNLSIEVKQPHLWSPDVPNLYRVVSKIYINDIWVDELKVQTGFRSIEFKSESGFYLNGESTIIKGVCLHHDGGIVGAAVPDEIWVRRLNKLKAGGVNAIRIAHNPASKRLLNLCDQLGFLVQDEFFDEWDNPKDKRLNMNERHHDFISRGYTEHFLQDAERDLKNTLSSHINHPCIFMWSIGNEIEWTYPRNVKATGFFDAKWDGNYFWSLPPHSPDQIQQHLTELPSIGADIGQTAQQLSRWVKQLDSTRPVTANCILPSASYLSGYADALDVIGFSYRRVVYDYGHEHYPHLPIIGNENLPQWHEWKAVLEREHVAGLFLWTGINYMGESHGKWPVRTTDSGLLDAAGFEKPSYALFRSLWNDTPFVRGFTVSANETDYVLDKTAFSAFEKDPQAWKTKLWVWDKRHTHWNYMENEWVVVEAYSNCDEVELAISGLSFGRLALNDRDDRVFRWVVPFEHGALTLHGFNQGELVTQHTIHTSETATKLSVADETDDKQADYRQLVIQLKDRVGRDVTHHEHQLSFDVEGCEWIGCDNGHEANITPHTDTMITTYQGRALAIVKRRPDQQGQVTISTTDGVTLTHLL